MLAPTHACLPIILASGSRPTLPVATGHDRVSRKDRGLTQTAAADLIGIARPDLSKILRGNLTVSLERLLNVMRALGSDVEIKVKVHPRRRRRGRISLVMN